MSDDLAFIFCVAVYLGAFGWGMLKSDSFRSSFKEYMQFKDPFGLKLLTENMWFFVLSVAVFAFGALVAFF